MDAVKTNLTLNLKGLLCPLPVVKISQAIKTIEVGEMIEAIASDPGVLADIPAWARSSGNELVSMTKLADREYQFVVKRAK